MPAFRRGVLSVVAGLGAVALVLGLAPGAQATPKPTIASVTAELHTLGLRNERLAEKFNLAGIDVAKKQKRANAAAASAKRAQAAYAKSLKQVRLDIVQQYKDGDMSSTSALLTSSSSQNYLDRLSALNLMASRRVSITEHLKTEKTAAAGAATTAADLLAAANKTRKALGVARANLKKQVGQYTTLLDHLTAAQKAKFLAIKQAKSKVIAQAPVSRSQRAAQIKTVTSSPAPAPSARAAIAVRFALAQIGKPYVFAASGPGAYDCSGLTMAAWGAAGVRLPHFAAYQYNMGHHVAKDQLEPGDLVFFYGGIQHVAMYIGHGMVVHAPHTGDVVRIAPLSEFGDAYVGATRLS